MAGFDLSQSKAAQAKPTATGGTAKAKAGNERDPFAFLNKEIKLFGPKFADKAKEAFYSQLGIMVQEGVDIRASLDLLEHEQRKKEHKAIVQGIRDALVGGMPLSEAMQKNGNFSPYEYFSVQIGEETGKLAEVLNELAAFYNSRLKQQRQFVNALAYPVLITLVAAGAVAFMLYFIVPMFADVFKRFNSDLPAVTQFIIDLSGWLSANGPYVLLAIIGVVGFFRLNRNKQWYRRYGSWLVMRIPVMGAIIKDIYRARFCSSMALLIGARVPLLRAIKLVRQMITFYPMHTSLHQVEADILQGEALHKSLEKFKIYEPSMIALLKVGEEVNRLDTFFNKLASTYSDSVEHRTSLLSTFLEPVMILLLGLVVGFILVSMYLPMFQISTGIG